MKASAFLECACHTGEIPGVFGVCETVAVLWAQDPGVVGCSALGVAAFVVVNQLSGRRHSYAVKVEGEVFFVLDKVKQVCVRAREFAFAVHAKGVVPDHPVSCLEAKLLCFNLELRGIFVTDGQPEGTVWFEDAMNLAHPVG